MNRKARIWDYILGIVLVLLFLVPVVYIISSSFKPLNELVTPNLTFFPSEFTFYGYTSVFEQVDFLRVIGNTFFVAVTSTILAVLINTMAGYALSKFRFKGDKIILLIILSTIMLPLEIIMQPIYQVLNFFGMLDTYAALIIPAAATPTGIFLMRQYLLTIPDDLIQSARIDGANEWQIFTRIIVPNAIPAISTLAIFSFMWRWNDYIWPLIAISKTDLHTITYSIANFGGQYSVDKNAILAASTMSMVPMLVVFLVFQKQFIQGTAQTGMKG